MGDEPRPPRGLKREGKRLWVAICDRYQLEAHHCRILAAGCTALDRLTAAGAALDKLGLTYIDSRGNPRARPEIAIERDSRVALLRSLRELSLDSATVEQYARPARVVGRYG